MIGQGESNPLGLILSNEGCFFSDGKDKLPQYGVLPVKYGGTGATNLSDLKESLGLGSETDKPLPIEKGGTGTDNISDNQILIKSNNKINSISATEAGQILVSQGSNSPPVYKSTSEITKVGTINSGVWNGTVINPAFGGTGTTSLSKLKDNLGLGSDLTSPLAVSKGGTGAVNASEARKKLSAVGTMDIIAIEKGGTGVTSASEARVALGINPENIGAVAKEGFISNNLVKGNYIVAPIIPVEKDTTLTKEHNGYFFEVNAAAAITLPAKISNYEVEIMRMTSGTVTIKTSSNESIYTIDGIKTSITIADQYGIVVLKSLGSSWVATGSI